VKLRRRGERYAVEVYDPREPGRRRWVGTYDREREARAAGRHAEEEVARWRGRQGGALTVADWAGSWLTLRPRQKASTNTAYAEQTRLFVERHGRLRLHQVTRELTLAWLVDHRWTLNGLRAMFGDALRASLVDTNPFAGLRLRGSRGRRDLDVLSREQVHELADAAVAVWGPHVGPQVRALIVVAAYVGLRPSELYALSWSDIDLRAQEVLVAWQYDHRNRLFTLPKNGQRRRVVLPAAAGEALSALTRQVAPRVVRGGEESAPLVFRAARGGAMSGRTHHYYFQPVRCAAGRPGMDFYELRHACASWLFNDLELPAQDVAHQLGHTDGGALVQRLYGHPSERLARERIKAAAGVGGAAFPPRPRTAAEGGQR